MNDDQILKNQLDNAPQEIRQLLALGSWKTAVVNIGKANSLSEGQLVELENEVLFVLLGMDLILNFGKNIQQNVNLSSLVAGGIAIEITQKVFEPVRKLLPTAIEEDAPAQNSQPKANLNQEILKSFSKGDQVPDMTIPELEMAHDEIAAPETVVSSQLSVVSNTEPSQTTPAPQAAATPTPIVKEANLPPRPLPAGMPQNTKFEEQIAANIQSPEADTPRVMVGQYKGVDPYREPIA